MPPILAKSESDCNQNVDKSVCRGVVVGFVTIVIRQMEEIKKFARYYKPYKLYLFLGVAFIFCGMLFGLYVPWLIGNAVDDLRIGVYNGTLTVPRVSVHVILILGVSLISGSFLFWQRRFLINTSRHIEYDMRRDFYAALVDQPLEFYHENRVGDLMARATNDLSAIRQIVGPMILYSFQATFALFSRVEWGFAAILFGVCLWMARTRPTMLALATLVASAVLAEAVWLLPALDARGSYIILY